MLLVLTVGILVAWIAWNMDELSWGQRLPIFLVLILVGYMLGDSLGDIAIHPGQRFEYRSPIYIEKAEVVSLDDKNVEFKSIYYQSDGVEIFHAMERAKFLKQYKRVK